MARSPENFRIVVLSGPSGSGKTTIVERLIRESPIRLVKSVSATTRPPRAGECHGEAYYFLSPAEFSRRQANQEFLETAEVFGAGYWYGTLRSELDRAKSENGWAFLEIDVVGAQRVMQEYPDSITIFLKTPSEAEFERRLRSRGTESEAAIERRLRTAREELRYADTYRHQVVNDQLDQAVEQILRILQNEEGESHAG